ncbi:MAG: rhodanese-like domain-containing protein [Myxococcales bacterium]|nr:rhodanese-like domain-containing protein [Myxococcales bacterium]
MTVKRVSPKDADLLIREQGFVYLDVRSIPEFEAGHPTGAYNIPLMHATPAGMRPNGEFMSVVRSVFAKHTKLVIGCRSGNRSLRAAEALLSAGFEHVVDQRAGLDGARDAFGQVLEPGWTGAGLPTATEAEPGRDYEALFGRKNR